MAASYSLFLVFNCRKTCTQHFISKRYNIQIRIIVSVRHLTQNRWMFYVFLHLFDVDVYKHLKDCRKKRNRWITENWQKKHTHNKQKHTFEMKEERKSFVTVHMLSQRIDFGLLFIYLWFQFGTLWCDLFLTRIKYSAFEISMRITTFENQQVSCVSNRAL